MPDKPRNKGGRPPKKVLPRVSGEQPAPKPRKSSAVSISAAAEDEMRHLLRIATEMRQRLEEAMTKSTQATPRQVTTLGQVTRIVAGLVKEARQLEKQASGQVETYEEALRVLVRAGWTPPEGV